MTVSASTLLLAGLAATSTAPEIDLYTMGPGDDIFSHFGHSAICVTRPEERRGICYNYGTADFSTPVPLTINFIRGQAMFWVSAIDPARMVDFYVREDRTVWRQRLPLAPEQKDEVARLLARAVQGDEKYYRYHHYFDNCTTRIRDVLDSVSGGALARYAKAAGDAPTFRDLTLRGFGPYPELQIVTDLILGRRADRPITGWEAMFLPEYMMRGTERALNAPPEVIYARKKPLAEGYDRLGRIVLAGLGALLAGGIALSARAGRRARRIAVATSAVALGLLALPVAVLAFVSAFPELRQNEVLLVLMPIDLLLPVLREPAALALIALRLVVLLLVAIGSLVGVLVQPLWPLLLLAGLPLLAAALTSPRE